MIVLLCIDYFRKPVNWNYPFLPRIGEKLFTEDFFPHEELKELKDYLVVTDVIWHRENTESKELCISLLLDYQK
ncbi:hypothetical protein [Chryseobacterium lathyri]|nr:hypothetical protein [Chryseobacterium lathyri]